MKKDDSREDSPYGYFISREIPPSAWTEKKILGIEITSGRIPLLGNIDPQHGRFGSSERSAIEVALHASLPDDGTLLVTDRPDADSFGAMAVFHNRRLGKRIDPVLVGVIGRVDSVGESNARAELGVGVMDETRLQRQAINQIIQHPNLYKTTEKQVRAIARILAGEEDVDAMTSIANLQRRTPRHEFDSRVGGMLGFAVVDGDYGQARSEGQQLFPYTLVYAPRFVSHRNRSGLPVRRYTIVMQKGMMGDMRVLEFMLSRAEADERRIPFEGLSRDIAWGGPEHIVSSPEGNPSWLSVGKVLEVVEEFVRRQVN